MDKYDALMFEVYTDQIIEDIKERKVATKAEALDILVDENFVWKAFWADKKDFNERAMTRVRERVLSEFQG